MLPGTVRVGCKFCDKLFLRDTRHHNETLKLGHNWYCSRLCSYEYRKTGREIVCENGICKKRFYRALNDILNHNYCSTSCAATVNNQKYPKRFPLKRSCKECGREFRSRKSKYCSNKCGWSALHNNRGHIAAKYTSEEIQETIKKLAEKLGRSPSRRELGNISYAAIRSFGSWNKAIEIAGLTPNRSHDHRMYKRTKTKATDGHLCDSVSEAIIDN